MRKISCGLAMAVFVAGVASVVLRASAPSGAIFTTVANGSEVNYNIYAAKDKVYLDGGPGPGAPQTAAGLDDGTYVFQVTDPSGKVLLSTDPAACRQVVVQDGVFVSVAPSGSCAHHTEHDSDHYPPAITVQLLDYLDTPNPGGVYKAWVTFLEDYTCDLSVVDCGSRPGNRHGFVPAHS